MRIVHLGSGHVDESFGIVFGSRSRGEFGYLDNMGVIDLNMISLTSLDVLLFLGYI